MKNIYLLGALAVCLTACGGGSGGGNNGGNGGNSAAPVNIGTQNPANNTPSTTTNNGNTSSNTTNSGNTSGNTTNSGNTSGNTANSGSTSGNTTNSGNTSGNTTNSGSTSGNTANSGNTSGNTTNSGSTSGNSNNASTTASLKTVSLVNESTQLKRYILNRKNADIEFGQLKLAQDTQYLTPQAGTQSTAESFKVKPMTESQKQSAQEILDYTNNLRATLGLPALTLDPNLSAFAQRRAEELAGRYDHTRPDGSDIFVQGLRGGGGENIASGYTTALAASEGWATSPGHYANMTNSGFTRIGIGVIAVRGSELAYQWVQIFGYDSTTTPYFFDSNPAAAQTKLDKVTADITGAKSRTITGATTAMDWIGIENGPSLYVADLPTNGKWHSIKQINDTSTYNAVINSYNDVRFGALKEQNGQYQVFYRGNNTQFAEIPTSGIFNYTGDAFMTDGNNNAFLNAAFQADFSNKKLDGVLSQDGNKMLDIHAVIRGSSFHSNADANVETQGSFFGTNAAELGGVFYDHSSNRYGAYGAKKQ